VNRTARLVILTIFVAALAPASWVGAQTASWELTPAGWRSGPIVEHLTTLPEEAGGAIGAVRHGRYLYVSGAKSFSIYDVRNPENPRLVTTEFLGIHALNEHPDTNGRILILSRDLLPPIRSLEVWDVRNKENPQRIGGAPSMDHTWACVLKCQYAYGSHGSIVSLLDPANPVVVGDWRTAVTPAPTRFHGIDEVAPGLVLTASEPTVLLDARVDPANPVALATADPPVSTAGVVGRRSVPSYAHWPLEGTERFALETIETPFSGPCTEGSGGLVTYDTAGFQETGRFEIADVFRLTSNGTFTDGFPPANAVGCSAFGLDESPDWMSDRLVAMAAMEHGVRLLHVDAEGQITEIGGFMGHGTVAAFPVWGTQRILYVVDLVRGVDVLRVAEPEA
jgi:hypothetical protein